MMNTVTHVSSLRGPASAEERAALKLGWIGLAVLGLTCGLFALWCATAPLAATAAADGVVKTDRNRRVVQHQEGGIVSDIRVRDGDRVKAGQVLVMLDDPAVRSELRKVRSMLDSELAKLARLEAERVLAKGFTVPPELSARASDATVAEVISREQRVFVDHRNSLDAQLTQQSLT